MTLFLGAGQSDGTTTLTPPAAALLGILGGSMAGAAGGSGAGIGNFTGGAVAAGVAGGSGAANVDGTFGGTMAGAASVTAETHPFGAGTSVGSGELVAADGAYLAGGSGTTAGAASTTGAGGVLYLSTGKAGGEGELAYDFVLDGSGTVVGIAFVTGSGNRIVNSKVLIQGTSLMVWSYPLPMVGKTIMTAHVEVEQVLSVLRAIVVPDKCFRYLQLLQRGDCSVFISDSVGPVSPVDVTYTLFQKRTDGSRQQVGPAGRAPVTGLVGEFYVTGKAGELGQPGTWVVQWKYRRSFQGPVEMKEQEYRVLDAALANDPRDVIVRVRKFGWN